jgi:hypothetical protein
MLDNHVFPNENWPMKCLFSCRRMQSSILNNTAAMKKKARFYPVSDDVCDICFIMNSVFLANSHHSPE